MGFEAWVSERQLLYSPIFIMLLYLQQTGHTHLSLLFSFWSNKSSATKQIPFPPPLHPDERNTLWSTPKWSIFLYLLCSGYYSHCAIMPWKDKWESIDRFFFAFSAILKEDQHMLANRSTKAEYFFRWLGKRALCKLRLERGSFFRTAESNLWHALLSML